jgi:uncharacterized protein YdeI (YjbR/CyaY-like superfamily)
MEPVFFDSPAQLRAWFEQHHDSAPELVVGFWKKATGKQTVSWSQAVDEALCFGWIDSQGRRVDDERHQLRFTPRRAGSVWSAVNIAKVAELTAQGRMRPEGLAAYEARRPERSGIYSHEQTVEATLDAEQTARFTADAAAWRWFSAQAPSYRRAAVHWVTGAKRADTRERRLERLIVDSAAGRKVPPLSR